MYDDVCECDIMKGETNTEERDETCFCPCFFAPYSFFTLNSVFAAGESR